MHVDGKVESVTEGYKYAINAYLKSFESPELYRKTIVGIHKYYYTTTKYSTISFSDCVNEIVSHFVPDDFLESMTYNQRDGVLRQVLTRSVKQFSTDIVCTNLLLLVIDDHGNKQTIRIGCHRSRMYTITKWCSVSGRLQRSSTAKNGM